MSSGRLFTIEEANALLPTLIPLVERILAARQELLHAEDALRRVAHSSAGNGGNKGASKSVQHIATIEDVMAEIEALGCQLKDVNSGLVDFPARREGRIVLLCWRYGEESVEWWHDLDTGFAGRQPL